MHLCLNISKSRKQSLRKKMKDAEKAENLPVGGEFLVYPEKSPKFMTL